MPASEKSQNIGKPANHSDTSINKLQSKNGKSSPESPTQTAPAMGNGSKPDLQKNDPSTNDRIKKTKDTLVGLKSIAHSLQAARDLEVTMDSSLESLTKFETSRSAFDQSLFCFSVANINLEIAILSLNRSLGRPDIEKLSQAADKLEDSGHVCQSELEKI